MHRVIHIAEDDLQLAEVFRQIAEKKGWSVRLAANGNELMRGLVDCCDPVLLLIDVQMPEADAIDVVNMLSESDRPFRLRFMTGGPDSGALAAKLIASAREMQVGKLLFKPIPRSTFEDMLDEEEAALAKAAMGSDALNNPDGSETLGKPGPSA